MGANIPDREQPGPFAKGPYSRIKWARADCKGKLKPLATAVYCYIAERAGPGKSGKDFKCTAAVKTMADDLNISRRTVQDLIHSLHWTGWLQASWKGEGRAKRFEWAVVSEHDLFVADDRFHDPKLTPSDVLRREKRWEKRKKVAAAATKVAAAATKVAAAATKVAAAAPDQEGEVEGELQGEVKVEPLACARPVAAAPQGEDIRRQREAA